MYPQTHRILLRKLDIFANSIFKGTSDTKNKKTRCNTYKMDKKVHPMIFPATWGWEFQTQRPLYTQLQFLSIILFKWLWPVGMASQTLICVLLNRSQNKSSVYIYNVNIHIRAGQYYLGLEYSDPYSDNLGQKKHVSEEKFFRTTVSSGNGF